MICDGLGHAIWKVMEDELLRVAKVVILLNYTYPTVYRVTSLESLSQEDLMKPGYLERTASP